MLRSAKRQYSRRQFSTWQSSICIHYLLYCRPTFSKDFASSLGERTFSRAWAASWISWRGKVTSAILSPQTLSHITLKTCFSPGLPCFCLFHQFPLCSYRVSDSFSCAVFLTGALKINDNVVDDGDDDDELTYSLDKHAHRISRSDKEFSKKRHFVSRNRKQSESANFV